MTYKAEKIETQEQMDRVLAESLQKYLEGLPPRVIWLAARKAAGQPPIVRKVRRMQVEIELHEQFLRQQGLEDEWVKFLEEKS